MRANDILKRGVNDAANFGFILTGHDKAVEDCQDRDIFGHAGFDDLEPDFTFLPHVMHAAPTKEEMRKFRKGRLNVVQQPALPAAHPHLVIYILPSILVRRIQQCPLRLGLTLGIQGDIEGAFDKLAGPLSQTLDADKCPCWKMPASNGQLRQTPLWRGRT